MIRLPSLDCHAHIAPDVTADQLARLAPSVVFAMTRSPDEARRVSGRKDQRIVWGLGAHPSVVAKSGDFDMQAFRALVPGFAVVGEVGLDRRSGHLERQVQVLRQILETLTGEPVMISLHSSGAVDELLDILKDLPHSGAVLHWFTGSPAQLQRAAALGCYFSINAAMDPDLVSKMPEDRLLPETDYPATRRQGVRLPGDTSRAERFVASIAECSVDDARLTFYRNLRTLLIDTGAIDRVSSTIADILLLI